VVLREASIEVVCGQGWPALVMSSRRMKQMAQQRFGATTQRMAAQRWDSCLVATWVHEDDSMGTLDSAARGGLCGDGKGRVEREQPSESVCSSESVGEEANENFASSWGSSSG
jgi:hypothetical protein